MNENRQIFVNTYLTNGYNATQAYKIAYPNAKSGYDRSASSLLRIPVVKEAIDKAKNELESWLEGGRELCDKLFSERYAACVAKGDNTNAIRCVENKAKHEGYLAVDEGNAERRELDESTLKHRRLIAFAVLTMEPEVIQKAIQVDSKVIEGDKDE